MADSYADLFHTARLTDTLILLTEDPAVARAMESPRLKREVGVIYARATEMQSHYLNTSLSSQFDAVIHLDRTRGVTALG